MGLTVPAITKQVTCSEKGVRRWLERCNAAGLEEGEDARRAGRPRTERPDVTTPVLATARSRPPIPAAGAAPRPPVTGPGSGAQHGLAQPSTGSPSRAH